MQVLTFQELDNYCSSFIRAYPNYGVYVNDYFQLLYNVGCRSSEPHNVTKWAINQDATVKLIPLKHNNFRTLEPQNIPSNFYTAIENQEKYFDNYSIAKFRYIFNKYRTLPQLFVDRKEIDLYIFRYRYVKSLYLQGFTKPQIQSMMGWTNSGMVDEYLYAEIYFN
jgi:hypothetical protein